MQAHNRPLYRAYLLKDTLASILDCRQYYVARDQLDGWLAWASRSKLAPFVRVARTIRKHLHGVLAYLNTGLSNGRSEGLNGNGGDPCQDNDPDTVCGEAGTPGGGDPQYCDDHPQDPACRVD